ncbi:uncharacterized protein LOC131246384 isoform X2 [Magnolia sinica]|uniref:uncharacterized protein LOC131246384 isoform X2 n=1 Tax=Magnolia sinica TaxID=86752 RepID=UPI002658C603|nr:uncharacterized protein LOC131246384 isoform X2 [Magnolia sinica]
MALDNPADEEEKKSEYPLVSKPPPDSKDEIRVLSESNSSQKQKQKQKDISPAKPSRSAIEFILSIARKLSAQPLQNSEPGAWGVLTAISANARKRPQGMNILLSADEHWLGRLVGDTRFQIEGGAVSANHCKIYRKHVAAKDVEQTSNLTTVFLKDNSTNGTFLNWEKLKKQSPEAQVQHGDIISFVAAPHNELALAFVYREICKSGDLENGSALKRKSDEFVSENKRLKGLGIGAPEGPISLDDVRSLQRSNTDLRKQLESHVHTIETLRSETRAAVVRHENEVKELKESVSLSYLDKIKELQHELEVKQKELAEVSTISAERQHAVEDLNERLSASIQSRVDADEIIHSQKATISELEVQLDDERNQRREEREKAVADLKAALQRAQAEAQEEIKRQADAALRQERELQEVISKLQESDKESRALVETLRSKLEDARESVVVSEKKVRQLEAQLHEEQLAAANGRKKAELLESEVKRLRKELESEKVAREEAWAKVSALVLEMSAAIRDLSMEKQRFQGARERIILRETQLRAFYSTTEEISALFTKQQEQLKAMQKTLEDEENYDNTSVDVDLNVMKENINGSLWRKREEAQRSNNTAIEASAALTPKNTGAGEDNASDDASVTEKHNCDIRSQEDGHTQDVECTSADRSGKGFGSDIDGVSTAPILDGDPINTERVLGTESEAVDIGFGEQNVILHKCSNLLLAGDTMQLDDETNENGEQLERVNDENGRCSQSNNQVEVSKAMEDTEAGTIRTADLLTSEVAGSWAISTAPSVHGENDSPRSGGHTGARSDDEAAAAPLISSFDGQAAGSQNLPSAAAATRLNQERRALNAMIGIVAPDFREQFCGGEERDESGSTSDVATEGSDHGDDDNRDDVTMKEDEGENMSDADVKEVRNHGDDDDDDDDSTEEDSVG